jgi:hypothetical protein
MSLNRVEKNLPHPGGRSREQGIIASLNRLLTHVRTGFSRPWHDYDLTSRPIKLMAAKMTPIIKATT